MEWKISPAPVAYEDAVAAMEARVRAIRECAADELVWLLEHPALFTAGASADEADLLDRLGLPVYKTGRGGQYTYHGPGQRIAYVMLDLKRRVPDVRLYVQNLEHWIIATLAEFGVAGFIRDGRVGVWVKTRPPLSLQGEGLPCERDPLLNPLPEGRRYPGRPAEKTEHTARSVDRALQSPKASGSSRRSADRSGNDYKEAKIAAIGVRIRQWVTYHGVAINVNPNLKHYEGIVPCGITEYGVTSLADLGIPASLQEMDAALKRCFVPAFCSPS